MPRGLRRSSKRQVGRRNQHQARLREKSRMKEPKRVMRKAKMVKMVLDSSRARVIKQSQRMHS